MWERARVKDHPKYFIAKEQTVEADLIIMNKFGQSLKSSLKCERMEIRNQRLPTDTHFAVHQNLATHLLSAVDEIVRLVPIPAIASIAPGPLSLPRSSYSSVDVIQCRFIKPRSSLDTFSQCYHHSYHDLT